MSTAKLKRKLGDLGVDISSRRANENFCLIGTPLPPLEKSKDTGEFVPVWKQEVRDEKGRKRLHGAFSGGFSAGFFNTVGSKEGWTPSTFISSRTDRAKGRVARPEDFMDEEDLAELRAGPEARTMAERGRKDGPITLALEEATVPPPKDSVGARILKKMGWRLGWGIGPRVSWRQHEIQYGRDPSATEVDEEAKKHTYPPRDTPLVVVGRKDDFHGIGYNKGLGLHASSGAVQGSSSAKQGPRLAGGFGLGVMNDADEDDLDVYDHAASLGKNRTAFDVTDVQDDERIRRGIVHAAFRDGTPVLSGFVLSDKPVAEDMWFPIPDVPQGWTPNPKQVWEKAKAQIEDKENVTSIAVPSQPQTHAQWKSGITPDQRGAALGETSLPAAPRSVFDYMSKKDQEKIKNIAAGRSMPSLSPGEAAVPTTSETPPGPRGVSIPHVEAHIAEAALRGFQPFASNPKKQARYTAFLRTYAEPGSDASIPPRPARPEAGVYAKAAALFRPVTGAMAGRFTSAAVLESGPKIVEGLHKPMEEPTLPEDLPEEPPKEDPKEEDQKAHAARLGMYGPMTREVKPWQPARLLCKRFGVKDPNPDMQYDSGAPASSFNPPSADDTSSGAAPLGFTPVESDGGIAYKRDLANIGLGEDDSQGDDILTYERPAMDIFKAIFASDAENSDEEDTKAHETADSSIVPEPSSSTQAATPAELPSETLAADIDMSNFKPTFIPRDPQAKTKAKEKEHSGTDKKSKKSKGAKGGVLVSFDLDEEGGEALSLSGLRHKRDRDRDRPKKRKKREGGRGEETWVEKPPPDIVKDLPPDSSLDPDVMNSPYDIGPPRGRKRAIDFM
ncbi:hypothetical protein F5J12DRAFT_905697 [Pisolithus orientalis]|uniref:uncharacterized protein n=1 Tax=Pisolithus orientalis TaxID=936130 RepID=UPI002224E1A9|nr:uncharacterized protein F5J12DRAFT_905697 [Pisolithus orientalis]KAI6006679.1 hypothetical protein F5J12DRAFT_905697 [Pisolithus orientalis]